MKKNFNVEVPFFPGFYESWAENCDTEYYAIEESVDYYTKELGYNVESDNFEFDYQSRRKDIIKKFMEEINNMLPECVISMKFTDMTSPREYNFSTDKLYANTELADDWLKQMYAFIDENHDWFEGKIQRDWTSRDGFISFLDNTVDEWKKNLKDMDTRYIGEMIRYMMLKYNHDIDDTLMEYTMSEIYDSEYVTLNEDIEKREYDRTHPKGWDMTNQMEISFMD